MQKWKGLAKWTINKVHESLIGDVLRLDQEYTTLVSTMVHASDHETFPHQSFGDIEPSGQRRWLQR